MHEKIIVRKNMQKNMLEKQNKKGEKNIVFVIGKKREKNMLGKNVRNKCAISEKWFEKIAQEKNTIYKKTSC